MDTWTIERVQGLAPDAASAKAGQGQAKASKWPLLGRSDSSVWGEVQGSGKRPYQVRIDLGEPAFKCTCPSRKFPCKHALGLLFLMAEGSDAIGVAEPPDWVTEWLQGRSDRQEKAKAKAEAKAAEPADPAAQAKRLAKREAKVRAGVEELGRWLVDVMRHGLAAAQTQPADYWERASGRLVDAQAPGLARMVAEVGAMVGVGDWQDRFMRRLGRLYLAVEGYRRQDTLDPAVREDLRSIVGWTQPKDELLAGPGVAGRWCVAGRTIEEDGRMTTQRTWLIGQANGRVALLLDFSVAGRPLDTSLAVGMAFDGELAFYPGATGQRAIVKARTDGQTPIERLAGHDRVALALDDYAGALAVNPWLECWPISLSGVTIRRVSKVSGKRWVAIDARGEALPMASGTSELWSLLSVSGGGAVSLFGEWDGDVLSPMGACVGGVYYTWPSHGTRGGRTMLARVTR